MINARSGIPFEVEVEVRQSGVPYDLTGCLVEWAADEVEAVLEVVDAATGKLRAWASDVATGAWAVGAHSAYLGLRKADGSSIRVYMPMQVWPVDNLLPTPDPHNHLGPQGTYTSGLFTVIVTGAVGGGSAGPPGTNGTNGSNGSDGVDGFNGWSPVLATITDGARRVLQVVSWAGGTGTPPASGDYVGPTGLTAVLASAIDVRGPAGADGTGSTPNAFQTFVVNGVSLVADSPTDTQTITQGTGIGLVADAGTDGYSITNTGVTSVSASLGVGVSASTGAVAFTNTGVRTLTGSTYIGVSASTGTPTITNLGVTTVNGATGNITTPFTFGSVNVNGTVLAADSTSDTLNLLPGTGIGFTPNVSTDSVTILNTGVTSAVNGAGISVSAATGAVTFVNTGVLSLVQGTGISLSATSGAGVVISSTGPSGVQGTTASAITSSNSGVVTFVSGLAVTVPAGKKVHITAELLFSSVGPTYGINYGFYLQQGGPSLPDGPDASYGSYNIDSYIDFDDAYESSARAVYKGGYLSVKSGGVSYAAYISQVNIAAGGAYGRLEAFLTNTSSSTLSIGLWFQPRVNGQAVTVERGSSFRADVL